MSDHKKSGFRYSFRSLLLRVRAQACWILRAAASSCAFDPESAGSVVGDENSTMGDSFMERGVWFALKERREPEFIHDQVGANATAPREIIVVVAKPQDGVLTN